MPLSRLLDFNTAGFNVSIQPGTSDENVFFMTRDSITFNNILFTFTNNVALQDGSGAGEGYFIINLHNVGRNFEKQILIVSISNYINDFNPLAISSFVVYNFNSIVNNIGKDELIKMSYTAVQSGTPKINVDLGKSLTIFEAQPK